MANRKSPARRRNSEPPRFNVKLKPRAGAEGAGSSGRAVNLKRPGSVDGDEDNQESSSTDEEEVDEAKGNGVARDTEVVEADVKEQCILDGDVDSGGEGCGMDGSTGERTGGESSADGGDDVVEVVSVQDGKATAAPMGDLLGARSRRRSKNGKESTLDSVGRRTEDLARELEEKIKNATRRSGRPIAISAKKKEEMGTNADGKRFKQVILQNGDKGSEFDRGKSKQSGGSERSKVRGGKCLLGSPSHRTESAEISKSDLKRRSSSVRSRGRSPAGGGDVLGKQKYGAPGPGGEEDYVIEIDNDKEPVAISDKKRKRGSGTRADASRGTPAIRKSNRIMNGSRKSRNASRKYVHSEDEDDGEDEELVVFESAKDAEQEARKAENARSKALADIKAEKESDSRKAERDLAFAKANQLPTRVMFLYPPDAKRGRVEITSEDAARLNPGCYLNDSLVDFYIKHLERVYAPDDLVEADAVFCFSSFFFGRLRQSVDQKKKIDYEGVRRWTKFANDIFRKQMVFVPVCDSHHWSLIVMANLDKLSGFVENQITQWEGELGERPTIIYLDSLSGGPRGSQFARLAKQYLVEEWLFRKESNSDDATPVDEARESTVRTIFQNIVRVVKPRVPFQTNEFDCGLYVLWNVLEFLRDHDGFRNRCLDTRSASDHGICPLQKAYSHSVVVDLRDVLRDTISLLTPDAILESIKKDVEERDARVESHSVKMKEGEANELDLLKSREEDRLLELAKLDSLKAVTKLEDVDRNSKLETLTWSPEKDGGPPPVGLVDRSEDLMALHPSDGIGTDEGVKPVNVQIDEDRKSDLGLADIKAIRKPPTPVDVLAVDGQKDLLDEDVPLAGRADKVNPKSMDQVLDAKSTPVRDHLNSDNDFLAAAGLSPSARKTPQLSIPRASRRLDLATPESGRDNTTDSILPHMTVPMVEDDPAFPLSHVGDDKMDTESPEEEIMSNDDIDGTMDAILDDVDEEVDEGSVRDGIMVD